MNKDKMIILLFLQFIVINILLLININAHPLSFLEWALFIALFLITAILFAKKLHDDKNLKHTINQLKRANSGSLNTRLFANGDHLFNQFIFAINELIQQLEKVQIQTIKSQISRKRLLSSISHDIRTPLTSIIGYIDALKDNIAVSEQEKQEYFEIIAKKANGLKDLIEEIFNLAKLDADEIPIKEEYLDFSEAVRESLIEFLPVIQKEGMSIEVTIPETKCYIFADRLSIARIINNIIKNAIQHGKKGKIIGIEMIETHDAYQLNIWDKGPGIPKADIGNVFERMYRSDQSRNQLNGGSGLGLAIAKALAEKNRGEIWAESIP
ncbi:HAMP domain-containing histidine kinase [Bacillus aquiflavi]|nr:HAMP domain-containing sensor histidine kinase [Bacillus aquiflavi]UAC49719.1 HAMP domain-containing histidine kinase [Bacillus aquiflavi]